MLKGKSISEHIDISEVPDGEYEGTLGGYEVDFCIVSRCFTAKLESGVKGINIPCTVKISKGELFVI